MHATSCVFAPLIHSLSSARQTGLQSQNVGYEEQRSIVIVHSRTIERTQRPGHHLKPHVLP